MAFAPNLRLVAQDDEAVLIDAVRRGSRSGQRRFFEEQVHVVERTLLRTLGPDRELADLTHDTFVRIFESLPALSDPQALKAWVMRIATRVAIDTLRARKRRRWLLFFAPVDVPEVESRAVDDDGRDALSALARILDVLSPEERVTFGLRVIEGLPLGEVATLTECSLATVKRRLQRAESLVRERSLHHETLSRWARDDDGGPST